jgi:hypothetical protein
LLQIHLLGKKKCNKSIVEDFRPVGPQWFFGTVVSDDCGARSASGISIIIVRLTCFWDCGRAGGMRDKGSKQLLI